MDDLAYNSETFEEDTRKALRERLLKEKLLGKHNETVVSITYDGYGDSGDIQDRSLDDEELVDFLFDIVEDHHSGWENNEGGGGTVTWDLSTDKITLEHYDNIISQSYTTTEILSDGTAAEVDSQVGDA